MNKLSIENQQILDKQKSKCCLAKINFIEDKFMCSECDRECLLNYGTECKIN